MNAQKLHFTDIFRKDYGKRNFAKYFTQRKKQMLNSQRTEIQNQCNLDSISRTSSIRVNQKFLHCPQNNKKNKPFSFELIQNEAQQTQNQNEFLQNLIKNQINSYAKSKNLNTNQSKRYKQKSLNNKQQKPESLIKIYKSNNYIQFSAYSAQRSKGKLFSHKYSQQSFQKAQKIRRQHSLSLHKRNNLSAKTSEDSTFFKPEQNPKRVIIFNKTFSLIDKGIFYSVEISVLKNRIVLFSDIVAVIKPKKFRLIMNPQDSKIFNSKWRNRLQQFIEKCLKVDVQHGITLNYPIFMHNDSNSSRILYRKSKAQMTYTSRKEEQFIKIGSIGMTKEYGSSRVSSQTSKKGYQNKKIKDQNLMKNQQRQNPQMIVSNKNNLNKNLSEIIEEQSKQIISKQIKPLQKEIQNKSKLQISEHFDNSQIINNKIQDMSKAFQKDLTLNISQRFQQSKPIAEINQQHQKMQRNLQSFQESVQK